MSANFNVLEPKSIKTAVSWVVERIHVLGFILLAIGSGAIVDGEIQKTSLRQQLSEIETQREIQQSTAQYLTLVQSGVRGALLYRSDSELAKVEASLGRALEAIEKVKATGIATEKRNNKSALSDYQVALKNLRAKLQAVSTSDPTSTQFKEALRNTEAYIAETLTGLQANLAAGQRRNQSHKQTLAKAEARIRYILLAMIVVGFTTFTIMGVQSRRRKLLDKMLNTSERLHRLIFTSLDEAVFLCTNEGTITLMNNQAKKLFATGNQDLRGKNLSVLFPKLLNESRTEIPLEDSVIHEAFRTRKAIRSVMIGRRTGKTNIQWLNFNSTPLLSEDHTTRDSVLISATDITEAILAQQLIEDQKAELISKSKMAALGELAGGIAHEINNPLAVISLRNEQLQSLAERQETIGREPVAKIAREIDKTVSRIVKIVRSVRGFARNAEEDDFEITPVAEIFEEVNALVAHKKLDSSSTLTMEIEPKDVKFRCRPTAIIQILVNLVGNGFDAMVEKEVESPWVKVTGHVEDDNLVLLVTNGGPKVSDEAKARLFQAFFTTKKNGQGTGLGLTLSRNLARGHGGELSFRDDFENTCFELRLPLHEDAVNKPSDTGTHDVESQEGLAPAETTKAG